jgi:hypothetical protein
MPGRSVPGWLAVRTTIFPNASQIGTCSSLTWRGTANGIQVTLSDLQTPGGPDAGGSLRSGPGFDPPRQETLSFAAFPEVAPRLAAGVVIATPGVPPARGRSRGRC